MAKKKTTKKKVLTIDGEHVSTDDQRLKELRSRMTPADRQNYDNICEAIKISLETGRLSVFPQLIKQKEEIERRYENDADHETVVTWDDAALKEAAGA